MSSDENTPVRTDERRTPGVPTHLKLALSVPEVAEMVGLSQASIRRLVTEGVLPTVPHTGRVLVARAAVERWVNSVEEVAS